MTRLDADGYRRERTVLSDAFRRLRDAAGLSGGEVAALLNWSQSKISKIETGRVLPSPDDAERLATVLGAPTGTRAELAARAVRLQAQHRNLRLLRKRGVHRADWSHGTHYRVFQPVMVPALLQAADYAQSVAERANAATAADVAAGVAAQIDGQSVLYDDRRRFDILVTEGALRWRLCDDTVMAAQMDRLISLSTLGNLRLGVIPLSARVGELPVNAFGVHDEREVVIETYSSRRRLTDPREIDYYLRVFGVLQSSARYGPEARELLAGIAHFYRRQAPQELLD
ncbi:MAG: helix-turn-helix domain-containing protein [Streptosporangiales bacterium]|nr:helix-turn-helix domain-containing protein [Streptosporangiales bacterium]